MRIALCTLSFSAVACAARNVVLTRVEVDEEEQVEKHPESFFAQDELAHQDFAGATGCDCVCDCVPGTDDCHCSCTCENPEDEEDAAKQKAIAEQRKLRSERRRLYERELQDVGSMDPSPAPTFETEEEECELDVIINCTLNNGADCDTLVCLSTLQCDATGNGVDSLMFSYTGANCTTSAGNSQGSASSCQDVGNYSSLQDVTVACFDEQTGGSLIVLENNDPLPVTFTVTNSTGVSLPETMRCTVSQNGVDVQTTVIDTSPSSTLNLQDQFGGLKVESCDEITCLETLNYQFYLDNAGLSEMEVTDFNIVMGGNLEDLLPFVIPNPLAEDQSVAVLRQDKIDVCTEAQHVTTCEASGTVPGGVTTCEDRDRLVVDVHVPCTLDVIMTCTLDNNAQCNTVAPPSGLICTSGTDTLTFTYTEKTCSDSSGNSQGSVASCEDLSPTNSSIPADLACADDQSGAPMTVDESDVASGTFTVTNPAGGDLPDMIKCTISQAGVDVQTSLISTSSDLQLQDEFGALQLQSCDTLSCIEVLNYQVILSNTGPNAMFVTDFTMVINGVSEDLLFLVVPNPLPIGASIVVDRPTQVDICTDASYTATIDAMADNPAANGCGCEDSDAYAIEIDQPEPTSGPTPSPSLAPSPGPSPVPSPKPSPGPSPAPSPEPSPGPSPAPSPEPSPGPSPAPSPEPSPGPSPAPSPAPSEQPSAVPSAEPTAPAPSTPPTEFTEEEDCIEFDPTPAPGPTPTATPTELTEEEDCIDFEPTPAPNNRERNLLQVKNAEPHVEAAKAAAKLQVQEQQQKNKNDTTSAATKLQEARESAFDFVVAGFPKCGTTTLLKAFTKHPETDMAAQEKCAVASPGMPDLAVLRKLDQTLSELSLDPSVKRSFKCPTAIYNHKTISRLEKHSPSSKFVIGVRHPVHMLQSFYNYRVTELYERGLEEEIPSLLEVWDGAQPWKGVSSESAKFELFLMQFGKTDISMSDMQCVIGHPGYQLAIRPNHFKVFLYTTDQLEDVDEDRSAIFRHELGEYLGLSEPLAPFGHENVNHQIGDEGHSETIDICDAQFADIRYQLVEQGKKTADWIRSKFMHSKDVFVANPEHFSVSLDAWGMDPCEHDGFGF